jgi:sugar/nucleoside kinase (ribokinase family)
MSDKSKTQAPTAFQMLSIGDAVIDTFLSFDQTNKKIRLDEGAKELRIAFGEKIDVDSYVFSLGGNGANVSVGLARLGIKTALFTEIGDDEFSLKIINILEKEGLDRKFITQARNQTASMSIAINYEGDRTMFVQHVKRDHQFNFTGIKTEFLYLTALGHAWKGAYVKALDYCVENGSKLVVNPGSLQIREGGAVLGQVLGSAKYVFLNKEEAERIVFGNEKHGLAGHEYIRGLLAKVRALGPRIAVITDGANGSFAQDQDGAFYVEKPDATEVVERTGAGDGYTAGFLAAVIRNQDIRTAMRWGSINAASVVRMVGAQAGLLKKCELEMKLLAGVAVKKSESVI